MRSFAHWTPRYVVNRMSTLLYERRCPDHPWLTRDANQFLSSYLRKGDVGLEFGSGRSTIWIAHRVSRLHSVETDGQWFLRVGSMIEEAGLSNVTYELISGNDEHALASAYEVVISRAANSSLDFCLVDGDCRGVCALLLLEKIRPGGILIIDNVERYLPSNSVSPAARSSVSGPADDVWARVETGLRSWRKYWTSNGVSDTAIFFKPVDPAEGA